MGADSKIEWTDHTFNPWLGCTKLSPACDHCYAEAWAKRAGRPELWSGQRARTSTTYWRQPLRWNEIAIADGSRPRVFCASLADVFDNQAPAEWRHDLFHLIRATPALEWQLLTKRPQNIIRMCETAGGLPRNAALGTTVEDQEQANIRVPHLIAAGNVCRPLYLFLSCEPLLGPVELWCVDEDAQALRGIGIIKSGGVTPSTPDNAPEGYDDSYPGIDWVICGGESGGAARPMSMYWAQSLRDQCAIAGVPFFLKQWGEWLPGPQAKHLISAGRDLSTLKAVDMPHETKAVGCFSFRVGKKAAGRLLDGVEHNGMPERAA